MLKAIIFDMDGLMVDTEIISFQCYKDIIESYGFNFTKKEYIEDYPGKSVISSMNFIKNKYNIDFDTDEKINQFKILEEQYLLKNSVELKKGLIQLLKYLNIHYYKTIVATSSGKERAERILGEHNLMKYFNGIVCGSEVEHGKPAPDIFLKACDKLNVEPEEALVLEDSEAGIQAASEAKISVSCIPDMKFPQEKYLKKVEHVYDSLEDVISYLEMKKDISK